jgi:CheY-like chemotaxis protein
VALVDTGERYEHDVAGGVGCVKEVIWAMRVLVIDDEKILANTLVLIMQKAGFEAMAVYNAAEALQEISSFVPDIVVSDVMMPGMNGIEVCSIIQDRHPNCHILLFSGQSASNDLFTEARAKGYTWELLAKPVAPDYLLAKLSSLS